MEKKKKDINFGGGVRGMLREESREEVWHNKSELQTNDYYLKDGHASSCI